MSKSAEVIIIREKLGQSMVRDVFSLGSLLGAIYVGVLIQSSALQWIAGLIWVLVFIGRMNRMLKDNRVTVSQARKRLDEIETEMNA